MHAGKQGSYVEEPMNNSCRSQFSMPLVSIIMPTLNSGKYLPAALDSVKAQTYTNIELIIVDGGSDDDTVEIAESHDGCRLLFNKDANLYAALNDGISACSGDIVCFLNSDDLLGVTALQKIAEKFEKEKAAQIVCGNAMLFEDNSSGSRIVIDDYRRYSGWEFDIETLLYGAPVINAHYFRKDVFNSAGYFDTSYSLAADREFMLRCYAAGLRRYYINELVYLYRQHPCSLTLNKEKSNAYIMGQEHLHISSVLKDSRNDILRRHSSRACDDASVSIMAACVRDRQFLRLIDFCYRHFAKDPLFVLRVPGTVIRKLYRRIQVGRLRRLGKTAKQ